MLNTRWPLAGECLVHCKRRSLLGCWFSGNQFVIISWCIASKRGWANRTYPPSPPSWYLGGPELMSTLHSTDWGADVDGSSGPPRLLPGLTAVLYSDAQAWPTVARRKEKPPTPSELSFHGARGMARHHVETALAALPVNWRPVSRTLCVRRRRPNYSTHITTSLLSAMDGQTVEVDGIPT